MLPSFLSAFSLARHPEIAALFSSVASSCTSSPPPPPPFALSPSVSAPAVAFPPSFAVAFPPSSGLDCFIRVLLYNIRWDECGLLQLLAQRSLWLIASRQR
ncbi:uncharacterized protein LOC125471735 [Pyrus x bretschneideri]|uniref:uncharacterized protein LOC125471735 n=1 Tax=Pyrus x bretschneideri TaxID=225117 RepID=UPI00202F4FE4|nr:uncharacterized protein LOC125471735 [Pyrus x bretschneideri]